MPGNQNVEPARSQAVRLDGGSPTTANPYSFTNVLAGSHMVGVSVPAGHLAQSTLCYNRTDCHTEACVTNQLGCPVAGAGATGAFRSVNVPAGGYADLWWHYTLVNPWVQILDGDVHANHLLALRIAPSPQFNARWLLSARGTVTGTSQAGWIARYYPERNLNWVPNNTPIQTPSYATLLKRFGKGAPDRSWGVGLPTTNGVYKMAGGTVSASFTLPGNRSVLIFVNGNLTINAEINVPANSVLAFIVAGEINFSKNLTGGGPASDDAGGLYLAQGRINTAFDKTSPYEVTRQLTIEGALISLSDTIKLHRNLSPADNLSTPAEKINLSAKYYVLGKSILGRPKFFWREIPAGF